VIRGDPELLSQAIINLLHNAVDAAENMERPVVKLFAARKDSEMQFSVSDNGCGIPPGILDEIYVPFFTTKKNGSGIGLTLSRQIALAHGGQLEPLPNPEGGITFRIVIPDRR
jgi:C4-dicarboxylate-specific signal transduction histidine kinase